MIRRARELRQVSRQETRFSYHKYALKFGLVFARISWLMLGAQYGGSAVKVGDEEYSLFRDHE